jgi:hypothetical protein
MASLLIVLQNMNCTHLGHKAVIYRTITILVKSHV